MKNLLSKTFLSILRYVLKDKKYLWIRASYSNSSKNSILSIFIVNDIYIDWIDTFKFKICVKTTSYGYDFKERDYVNEMYSNAFFSLHDIFKILMAQPFLKWQFSGVDKSKEPKDFYESVKHVNELL